MQKNAAYIALIKKSESFLNIVSCRVLHGSVFGPLLFILFINNMTSSVEYCKVHHYMNDTNLLLTDDSPQKK